MAVPLSQRVWLSLWAHASVATVLGICRTLVCPEPTQVRALGIVLLLSYNIAVSLDHKPFPALCWNSGGRAVLDTALGKGPWLGWKWVY